MNSNRLNRGTTFEAETAERTGPVRPAMGRTILAIVATTEREKKKLAEIGYRLGRKTFEDVPRT